MTATDAQTATVTMDFAKCDCCGLTEECTSAYIERIRGRFQGKWICGLCSEAVKDEVVRCESPITIEEAVSRHFNFCNNFRSSGGPPVDAAVGLISAVRQILRKSLDSPKSLRSMPCSSTKIGRVDAALTRSKSCIPSLNLDDLAEFRGDSE